MMVFLLAIIEIKMKMSGVKWRFNPTQPYKRKCDQAATFEDKDKSKKK